MIKLTDKLQLGLSGRYYSDVELDGTVNGTLYFPKNDAANTLILTQLKPTLDGVYAAGGLSTDEYKALLGAYSGASAPVYADAEAKATLPLPADFGIGLSYKAIDKENSHLLLAADFMYTQWSAWGIIPIEIDGEAAASKLNEQWEDMYRVSLGAEYKMNSLLTLRGSYYLEQNAAVLETLTPVIPDINARNVVNVGFQLNLIPGLALHASYEKIFIGDTEVTDWNYDSTEGDYLNMAGNYKMKVDNIMMGLGFNF
jgi:long-chain fatty acid transport protein